MAMTNSEIRAFAWERLWKGRWFWKLFWVALFMQICMKMVFSLLGDCFAAFGVEDWTSYIRAWISNWQDQVTPIPVLTKDYVLHATSATAFTGFLGFVLVGIAAYAGAIVLLKCLNDDQNRWFADSLAGFKIPFGLFGLAFVRSLIGFVWTGIFGMLPCWVILLSCQSYLSSFADSPTLMSGVVLTVLFMVIFAWIIFCALVPFYRYRFIYLIKAQHPDYSVRECLRASKEWMKGRAWASFKLDCSYWKLITIDLVLMLAILVLAVLCYLEFEGLAGSEQEIQAFVPPFLYFLLFGHIAISTILLYYISVGQGKFYLNHE